MRSKYQRPEFISKADMREEMTLIAKDLRKASHEQTGHETLREWALNAAEILEVLGSGPTFQERLLALIGVCLGGYGFVVLLTCGFDGVCCR